MPAIAQMLAEIPNDQHVRLNASAAARRRHPLTPLYAAQLMCSAHYPVQPLVEEAPADLLRNGTLIMACET